MKRFRKGDRVKMYSATYGEIRGTITLVLEQYAELIGDGGDYYTAHVKQLRKLIPRKRSGAV